MCEEFKSATEKYHYIRSLEAAERDMKSILARCDTELKRIKKYRPLPITSRYRKDHSLDYYPDYCGFSQNTFADPMYAGEVSDWLEAFERFETNYHDELFDNLSKTHRILLTCIAKLTDIDNVKTPTTSQVYQEFQERVRHRTLSYRRIADLLKELEVMGLIGLRNLSRGRDGQVNEVWLKLPAETIYDQLCIDPEYLTKPQPYYEDEFEA